ncbi:MAG: hypothetical protein ACJ746_03655 [Bryobacteraceae bacterium]
MAGQPRIYPNLNPAAAIPVDRDQIFRLESFFNQFRLTRAKQHGQYVPNSKYVFVRMARGETLLHPTFRHPALAEGHPVHYAGEAYFDNGRLMWWSNGSGNYRPDPDHAEQAGFPMDRFFTYDEIQKGVHQQPATVRQSNDSSLQMQPAQRGAPFRNRTRT